MIKSVKRCLKVLKNAKLTYDELIEVEAVLNSRPISYVSSKDTKEPLTSSHILYGRSLLSRPSITDDEEDPEWQITRNDLTRRQAHMGNLIEHFWKRWKHEYLLELRESHRLKSRGNSSRTVSVGNVVVVHDDTARATWRLGQIEEFLRGEDNQARGAKIRITNQGMKPSILKRPVQKLITLEINDSQQQEQDKNRRARNFRRIMKVMTQSTTNPKK